ncbi:Eco57I restriction-modification methylase domain-containing protein [Plantactinospora sp. DSM 117369]
MASKLVPGATTEERRRLAALGALAKALAPETYTHWPPALKSWIACATDELDQEMVREVHDALRDQERDIFADVYEQLVSGANRRFLGTFFTPPAIVAYMVEKSKKVMKHTPTHIIDPGAGVGAFTLAAQTEWSASTTVAVDINVVTLGLLAARVDASIARGSSRKKKGKVDLAVANYLKWIDEHWPTLQGPRLVLGNPPYTRHQEMEAKDKQLAKSAAGDLITSGLAGLSAYFVAATLRSLGAADAMCLLLPGSWCETRYGRELRSYIWNSRRRRIEIDLFPSRLEVFPGTKVTAMILLVGPERKTRQPFIARAVDLTGSPQKNSVTIDTEARFDRNAPCPPTFTKLLYSPRQRQHIEDSIPLGTVARIRRGVATGANSYFFLTDERRSESRLPDKTLRPALVKASHCPVDILTEPTHSRIGQMGLPRWLLDLNGSDAALGDPALREFLAEGRRRGAHNSHLARQRKEWHTVEIVHAPDIFLAPVGKTAHRVILNEVGAVGSNNLYGIYLDSLAPWTAAQLTSWLRSEHGQQCLRFIGREYQGGSVKIEPRALRALPVPLNLVISPM